MEKINSSQEQKKAGWVVGSGRSSTTQKGKQAVIAKPELEDEEVIPAQSGVLLSQKTTRNKKIDFSKLGQKKTLSNWSCHKCKTMIQVDEENLCKGGAMMVIGDTGKKSQTAAKQDKKKILEPCQLRFCSECLEKHYRESWLQKKKNPETWICPVCEGACNCSQCARKKNKETTLRSKFGSSADLNQNPTQDHSKASLIDTKSKLSKQSSQQLINPKKGNDKGLQQVKSGMNAASSKETQKKQAPIIEIKRIGGKRVLREESISSSSALVEPSRPTIKPALADSDWALFNKHRLKFDEILYKHDWAYIPQLQRMKLELFPQLAIPASGDCECEPPVTSSDNLKQ